MDDWELEAREQIRDTVARYTHSGDSAHFEGFVDTFTEDGVLEVAGGEVRRGRATIRESMNSTQESVQRSMRRPMSRHFVSNVLIEFDGESSARVRSYFLNVSSEGLDHWGRYRDQFVKVDDRWLIAHRYARVDGRVEGSWGPPPPGDAPAS